MAIEEPKLEVPDCEKEEAAIGRDGTEKDALDVTVFCGENCKAKSQLSAHSVIMSHIHCILGIMGFKWQLAYDVNRNL